MSERRRGELMRSLRWTATTAALACALAACSAAGTDPDEAPVPTATATVAESAAPAPTDHAEAGGGDAAAGCDWEARGAELGPAEARHRDLESAVAMEDWVWGCVDGDWWVEAATARDDGGVGDITAQALDLVAPDGTHVELYPLRTDLDIGVVDADLDARLAWTSRVGRGDMFQVVQVDLVTGESTERWGGGAVPELATYSDGLVRSVLPLRPLRDGTDLWAAYTYTNELQALFVHVDGAEFAPIPGQEQLDAMVADGAVNGDGDPGLVVWVGPNQPWAVFLAQRSVGADPRGSSELGRWWVVDLDSGETRAATGPLPSGLCSPDPDAVLSGTFEDPGAIPARCYADGDARVRYALSLEGDPVRR